VLDDGCEITDMNEIGQKAVFLLELLLFVYLIYITHLNNKDKILDNR
jgi:hypothetical protein